MLSVLVVVFCGDRIAILRPTKAAPQSTEAMRGAVYGYLEAIMMDKDDLATGTAWAGAAIAAALLETLFDKGILTREESRGVLDRAMKALAPVMQTPAGFQASRVIGTLQTGKFSARG
jgi:hypothetical protein